MEAERIHQSILSAIEKKTLIWLAKRMPAWVNSDHLTALGFLSLAAVGLSYWYSRHSQIGLALAIVFFVLNWFGDSLDGTLARVRNRQRPRYGFYLDYVLDSFGSVFVFAGLALSGYMSERIAVGLLVAYLLLIGRGTRWDSRCARRRRELSKMGVRDLKRRDARVAVQRLARQRLRALHITRRFQPSERSERFPEIRRLFLLLLRPRQSALCRENLRLVGRAGSGLLRDHRGQIDFAAF